ncbi:MAG: sensor histidine kinase [Bacteroidia bacterium]|nr:sensor histidine kinase [Bacteroidia bacterium]
MKKDPIIFATVCTLLIAGITYALSFVPPLQFHPSATLFASIAVPCFAAILITYRIGISRKLNKIMGIVTGNAEAKGTSLNGLRKETEKLLRERKEELEKIQKLERHRREFLGNISHELKTPLFHIQGYISTLAENNIEDPELVKRYLERTGESIERLIRILEDLDTISQLETEEMKSDMEPFDMVELCREVLASEESNASKKNIALILMNEYEKMAVMGDRFRIRQVLPNLVVNSIRYGKKDGETRIRLKNEGDMILTEVADNGIGIAPDHLPRLFERFYRVDKGRSRQHGGTGLGLSIVKHILETHHQAIRVMSTEGVGSVFSFHLKKAPRHSSFS